MIDLTIHPDRLERAVKRARERKHHHPNLPTDEKPGPGAGQDQGAAQERRAVGCEPLNLFRITWHNAPVASGGGFGGVTTWSCRRRSQGWTRASFRLVGKWVPHGRTQGRRGVWLSGAAMVTGQFDPTTQKAVWPSTGNYLSGRRLRFGAAGLPIDRHPA